MSYSYFSWLPLLLNVQLQLCFKQRGMLNISITLESVTFINIEHAFSKCSQDPTILLVSLIGYILILTTNISLIKFILNQSTKTFLDWMMVFDSILCLCNIITIAYIVDEEYFEIGKNLNLCYFLPYFTYCINLLNRLLTIGIVVYRYVFVIKHSIVWTQNQRRTLGTKIFGAIIVISLLMTSWATFYKDESQNFLCKSYSIRLILLISNLTQALSA